MAEHSFARDHVDLALGISSMVAVRNRFWQSVVVFGGDWLAKGVIEGCSWLHLSVVRCLESIYAVSNRGSSARWQISQWVSIEPMVSAVARANPVSSSGAGHVH